MQVQSCRRAVRPPELWSLLFHSDVLGFQLFISKLPSFNSRSFGGQPGLRCGVEPVGGAGGLLPPLV